MLCVIMLSVIMLSVMAPYFAPMIQLLDKSGTHYNDAQLDFW